MRARVSRHDLDEDATIFATDLEASQETPQPSESFDATVYATDAPPARSRSETTDPESLGETSNPAAAQTHDGVDRTRHALQGMEMGALFRHRFRTVHFGIAPRWRVRLNTPDGMTTEGGAKARQALVIHREGSPNVGTFTFGHLDAAKLQAKLKTYEVMQQAYVVRYGREFEMVESEYERLLDEVRKFLSVHGYALTMSSDGPDGPVQRRGRREGPRLGLRTAGVVLAIILLVGIAIGYALGR